MAVLALSSINCTLHSFTNTQVLTLRTYLITNLEFGKFQKFIFYSLQVRTKSRDSQSSDSAPTPIPPAVLRGVVSRVQRGPPGQVLNQPVPPGYRAQRPQAYQQQQQVIEHDENLSDKEIFPTANRHDPQQQQAQVTI